MAQNAHMIWVEPVGPLARWPVKNWNQIFFRFQRAKPANLKLRSTIFEIASNNNLIKCIFLDI
jgi:hypothetical protein